MIKMVRNLMTTAAKGNKTRLYFEPTVLEEAGFQPGQSVSLRIENDLVILIKDDEGDGIISRRQRPGYRQPRPYFDRKNQELTRVLRAHQRIDMIVYEGKIVVRGMTSFSLVECTEDSFQGADMNRLRCFSLPVGAGVAKASLVDTGLFECVGGIDIWNAAIDTFRHNFKNCLTLFGDIRHFAGSWIPKADVTWLSCECTDFSALGVSGQDVVGGLAPHYARLTLATGARAAIFEQVPQFFKSRSYRQLRDILAAAGFNQWYETTIDAHQFGSIPSRLRGYAVAFRDHVEFEWPQAPKIPARFRQTVGQVLGADWESKGDFKPITGSYMESLQNRTGEKNNFTAHHNHTLIGLEDTRMAAILKSYSRTNSTNSYLLHPDGKHWRKFLSEELSRFLHVPSWFQFPEWLSENLRTQLLGQSVDGAVTRAIGTEVAVSLMKYDYAKQRGRKSQAQFELPFIQNRSGQVAFMI